MSDPVGLMQERVQLYKDTARHKKTSRVLNVANMWNWIVYDSGYKLSEALFDYGKMEDALFKFQEKYQFDYYMDYGIRNPLGVQSALGHTDYIVNDEANALNVQDINYMEPGDYDDILDNYFKFLWTKYMPRKYPQADGPDSKAMMLTASQKFAELGQYIARINQQFVVRYGVPPALGFGTPAFVVFYEILFNFIRGIKGLSIDLRQRPGKVKDVCDALGTVSMGPGPNFAAFKAASQPGTDMNRGPDLFMVFLGHTILSKKQFEVYYWPYLKEVFDFTEQYDKILHIFAEGENSRLYEFYKQAPKGRVVIHLEMDDLFRAKKELGDTVCLCGGMPVDLLYHGTRQENIDYAKRLIDELAADGGFMFSQNKMVSYPNDCKAENLKAVNDFVREYTLS